MIRRGDGVAERAGPDNLSSHRDLCLRRLVHTKKALEHVRPITRSSLSRRSAGGSDRSHCSNLARSSSVSSCNRCSIEPAHLTIRTRVLAGGESGSIFRLVYHRTS